MARNGIRIRRAKPDDLPGILEIERQAFGPDAWDREGFDEYFAHPEEALFLLAEDLLGEGGGQIAGYAVSVKRRGIAELDSIAVLNVRRRSGIARQLLARIVRSLRRKGVPELALMVRRDNQAAIRLYREFGFKRMRTVNRYYHDGGPAWRMRLSLLD